MRSKSNGVEIEARSNAGSKARSKAGSKASKIECEMENAGKRKRRREYEI